MPSGTTENINELLELLNISENLLRTNTLVEREIRQHGGTVLYSYNDIIIASEVSEESYGELLKNPLISSMYELPLKSYGEIDISLIGQLDISRLDVTFNITGDTTNQSGGSETPSGDFVVPTITNTNLSISGATNQVITYKITTTGTQPIIFEASTINDGTITVNGDTLSIKRTVSGIADITIKATNTFGFDTKTLTVTTGDPPKITSPLRIIGVENSGLTYTMTDTGVTYSYRAIFLPNSLVLSNNIISGTLNVVPGLYEPEIVIENEYGYDRKVLEIIVTNSGGTGGGGGTSGSTKPVFTSADYIDAQKYEYITPYVLTATGSQPISFNIVGTLPNGLSFKNGNTIEGRPTVSGEFSVTMKAINFVGVTLKTLDIYISSDKPE